MVTADEFEKLHNGKLHSFRMGKLEASSVRTPLWIMCENEKRATNGLVLHIANYMYCYDYY